MIDLYREICKPVLKLDFTAHSITESQKLDSEDGKSLKKSVKDGMCCVRTPMPRDGNAKKLPANITKLKSLLIKSSIQKFASNLILFSY